MDNTRTLPNTVAVATLGARVSNKTKPPPAGGNVAPMENCREIDEAAANSTAVSTICATKNLRTCFQAIGFRMPKQHRHAYIVYSLILNSLATVFFPISFAISYFRLEHSTMGKTEFGIFLISLQVSVSLLMCEFKLVSLVLMRHKWSAVDAIMERLDRRCRQSVQEQEELHQCVRLCNRCMIFFIVAYLIYAMSTFLEAFFHGRTPYNLYLPFLDRRRSRYQFFVASFIEFALVSVACVQQAYDDAFAVVHVCILRSHMRILLLRFAKLGSVALSLEANLVELKQCIRDHKNYLELYNIIAPVISVTMFIQFVFTAILLSTTFVNIMIFTTDFYSRVGSACFVFAVIVEVVPICYYAQCLMDDSNRLPVVIFHSDWVDQDVRYRKMLVFLQQRTQCTKDLMAGKFFPINLSCCLSILKFSFTLYTFITAMGLEEKFENL